MPSTQSVAAVTHPGGGGMEVGRDREGEGRTERGGERTTQIAKVRRITLNSGHFPAISLCTANC